MHLFIEYYRPACEARRLEIEQAIVRNLRAPFVSEMTLFCQDPPPAFPKTHVRLTPLSAPRQTYQGLFDAVNRVAVPGQIYGLINNDISLEAGFERLANEMTDNAFIALTRRDPNGVHDVYPPVSQDGWFWTGRCRIQNANFNMGICGCDNRIAAEAYLVGYEVSNPCEDLVLVHHHQSQVRREDYAQEFVEPPYVSVSGCRLGEKSELGHMIGGEKWVRERSTESTRLALSQAVRERLGL